MFGLTRWTILITAVVVSAIFAGITVGIAQSPSPKSPSPETPSEPDPLPQLTLPQLPLPQVPLPETPAPVEPPASALKHISDILQGKKPSTGTGGLEMNGLGKILGEMGSVLDGSPLDPALEIENTCEDSEESARAVAAELLLKTARKLEQISPADPSRRQLVIQMRGEAVKLLSQ
jgi:hypothetical protein